MFKRIMLPSPAKTPCHITGFCSGVVFIIATMLALMACSQDSTDKTARTDTELKGKLIITGSSTVAPLVAEIAKQFEAQHPLVRVDVQTGGSSRGIADVRSDLADIGMISRSLTPSEQGLTQHALARDGIGIITHKDNPLTNITSAQIKDIYLGNLTDWQTLNGNLAPITVINKAEGRSTLELFLAHFNLKNSDIKASIIIGDNEQGVKTVIGNQNAIAYVSIGTAEYNIHHGTPIKLLSLDGIESSSLNVANASYPLARTLNLIVANTHTTPLMNPFIEFSQSPAVSAIIKELSFVPFAQ